LPSAWRKHRHREGVIANLLSSFPTRSGFSFEITFLGPAPPSHVPFYHSAVRDTLSHADSPRFRKAPAFARLIKTASRKNASPQAI